MARARAAATKKAGRSANGAGSVVARPLASGSTADDVFWSHRDADGNPKRGVECASASYRDAEKPRRTVTATVDARAHIPPQRMTVAQHLTEWLNGLRLKPQTLAG